MADQLYVSYWIRGFNQSNMARHFEKLLQLFPFSVQPQGRSVLQIQAVDLTEPPVAELAFEPPVPLQEVMGTAKEFESADSSYGLETWWDLWQYDTSWKLAPARVTLRCFGPAFEDGFGDKAFSEDLRIEFGIDAHFLPQPHLENHLAKTQSNIKGLLRLVHALDDGLPVEKRQLWSESGENFAERLQEALAGAAY